MLSKLVLLGSIQSISAQSIHDLAPAFVGYNCYHYFSYLTTNILPGNVSTDELDEFAFRFTDTSLLNFIPGFSCMYYSSMEFTMTSYNGDIFLSPICALFLFLCRYLWLFLRFIFVWRYSRAVDPACGLPV